MKLYNIFYIYRLEYSYEATTNDPQKWLEEHNKQRILEGADPDKIEDFDIVEVTPIIFNKEGE